MSSAPQPDAVRRNLLWQSTPPAAVGVVIPTYNRRDVLVRTLEHLERQTTSRFEVVVVDDGSTDGTGEALDAYLLTAPYPLTVTHQPNSGPARARNAGARLLRAPLCVLIGDDIFASPNFLAEHMQFHLEHPEPAAVAVGLTRWAAEGQTITPLMRWLDREGIQFAYAELERGAEATWKHFYTSNLSMKTALLRENPFNETFRLAGMEDIELGYRLFVERGLTMRFVSGATAEHLHPTNYERTCRRAIEGGRMYLRFAQLWPEQRHRPLESPVKQMLLQVLSEGHVILPALRWLTELVTRVWCPNPLLLPTLILLDRMGYRLEERSLRDCSPGTSPSS